MNKVNRQARARFAQAIRQLRGGRSYRRFGDSIGVSHTTLLRWERCEWEPDKENLEKVAHIRGETAEEFEQWLEGTREPSPLQHMVQQMHTLPLTDLATLMRAIADRIASLSG